MLVFSKNYFINLAANQPKNHKKFSIFENGIGMFQDSLKNMEVHPFIELRRCLEQIAETLD